MAQVLETQLKSGMDDVNAKFQEVYMMNLLMYLLTLSLGIYCHYKSCFFQTSAVHNSNYSTFADSLSLTLLFIHFRLCPVSTDCLKSPTA